MAGLGRLAKMVNKATQEKTVTEQFLHDLEATIKAENLPRKPAANYKPSMLGGCLRKTYFCKTGVEPDVSPPSSSMAGIWESGSARHEHIQEYVMKMKEHGFDWEWVDVEEFVKQRKPAGTRIVERKGNEVKLFNDILELSFMCDGVVKNNGRYYILEIKTESSFKFMKHQDAHESHKVQAICYSTALGIDEIIFIYENRDVCTKKVPPHVIKVTEEMKQEYVIGRIETINNYIAEDRVPPMDTSSCTYCDYKTECKKWGETDE